MSRFPRRALGARLALAGFATLALLAAACAPSSTASPSGGSFPVTTPAPSATTAASASASLSASPSAEPSASALPAACTTVATGLLNPRGITIASDGTIYVAEAGTGGTEPDFPTDPIGSPSASAPASAGASGSPQPAGMHGETGRVTMVTPDGQQSVLVDGLTSYSFLGETIGPAGVAIADNGTIGHDGPVYISIGGAGPATALFVPAGTAGQVVSVDANGIVTPVANIAQYERENNPDPNAVDSNLGGMAMGADGLLYVADSGGNDLYSVDPTSGEINVVAVFPGLPTPDGAANPARGGAAEVDPVPTSVFADPNGGVYVGLLGGAHALGHTRRCEGDPCRNRRHDE